MMIRCMIVDDEPLAHGILKEYLAGIPGIEIAGHFYNTIDARSFLEQQSVDLLFLDIKMPEEDGLSFLKALPEKPITILVTALLDHALEAYDLDVIDYLVKPIRPERFQKAMGKATDFLRLRQEGFVITDQKIPEKNNISIKSGREKIQIATETISHIQALKDYMLIYTPGGKYIVRSTVKKMLNMLPPVFIRVHKSFIINKGVMKRVTSSRVDIAGFTIPVGKHFRQSLDEK